MNDREDRRFEKGGFRMGYQEKKNRNSAFIAISLCSLSFGLLGGWSLARALPFLTQEKTSQKTTAQNSPFGSNSLSQVPSPVDAPLVKEDRSELAVIGNVDDAEALWKTVELPKENLKQFATLPKENISPKTFTIPEDAAPLPVKN